MNQELRVLQGTQLGMPNVCLWSRIHAFMFYICTVFASCTGTYCNIFFIGVGFDLQHPIRIPVSRVHALGGTPGACWSQRQT